MFTVNQAISRSITEHESLKSNLDRLIGRFKPDPDFFYIALRCISRHHKYADFLEFKILFSFVIVYFVEDCPKQWFNRYTSARDEISYDPGAQFQKYDPSFLTNAQQCVQLYRDLYDFFKKEYEAFSWKRACERTVFDHMNATLREIRKHRALSEDDSLDKRLFRLGGGGFGKVYRYQDADTLSVAIKVASKKDEKSFKVEKAAYDRLHDCPNITQLISATIISDAYFLCLEYVDNGDLSQALRKKTIPAHKKIQIALDIAQALQFMHDQKIVHMDIKAANVLLTRDYHAKITDFGLSLGLGKVINCQHGSLPYMPPEIYIYCISSSYTSNLSVASSMDMYSFSILLFELFFIAKEQQYWPQGLYKDNNLGRRDLKRALAMNDEATCTVYDGLNQHYSAEISTVDEDLSGLVSKGLHTYSAFRPTFNQAIEVFNALSSTAQLSEHRSGNLPQEDSVEEIIEIEPEKNFTDNINDTLDSIGGYLAECRASFLGLFPSCSTPAGITQMLSYLANTTYNLQQKAQYLYEMALGRTKNCFSSLFRQGKTTEVYKKILEIFDPTASPEESVEKKFQAFEQELATIILSENTRETHSYSPVPMPSSDSSVE